MVESTTEKNIYKASSELFFDTHGAKLTFRLAEMYQNKGRCSCESFVDGNGPQRDRGHVRAGSNGRQAVDSSPVCGKTIGVLIRTNNLNREINALLSSTHEIERMRRLDLFIRLDEVENSIERNVLLFECVNIRMEVSVLLH